MAFVNSFYYKFLTMFIFFYNPISYADDCVPSPDFITTLEFKVTTGRNPKITKSTAYFHYFHKYNFE